MATNTKVRTKRHARSMANAARRDAEREIKKARSAVEKQMKKAREAIARLDSRLGRYVEKNPKKALAIATGLGAAAGAAASAVIARGRKKTANR